ncbi:MAG: Gfo/Idh/MocA family oxidoreductase [Phycisphaerae bacterium]|nr:Gfo/Idh/MocA family oxidoreductase [Phycisphaerae bacterium]
MNLANLTRRQLLADTARTVAGAAAVSTLTAASMARAASANERLVIGMMGTGGRGQWLLREELATQWPDVDIAYLCDVDAKRLHAAMGIVEKAGRPAPTPVKDFRAILDDKKVDALFVVTPDHWHALPAILACQAGKDVFLEKPAAHNAWEGRKIVEAARKYQRVVQLGTQTRSGTYTHEAVEFLRAGRIGDIHMARVYNMVRRPPIDPQPDGPAPENVDYDLWTGPAPLRPFNPNRFHYHWHWCWDFSGGDIINDGVHQIDAARMLIGRDYPNAVTSTGGKLAYQDAAQTPDTQIAVWEFDNLMMVFELALWAPHMQKTPWDYRDTDGFPNWQFNATKIEVHGTKGLMYFSRHGGGWQAWNPDGKEIANGPGRHPHHPHLANFFECVRTRRRPNADIEEGHRSTLLCQMANISYRLGGRKLIVDGNTESFANDPEANAMLKRPGRPPWIIPENV